MPVLNIYYIAFVNTKTLLLLLTINCSAAAGVHSTITFIVNPFSFIYCYKFFHSISYLWYEHLQTCPIAKKFFSAINQTYMVAKKFSLGTNQTCIVAKKFSVGIKQPYMVVKKSSADSNQTCMVAKKFSLAINQPCIEAKECSVGINQPCIVAKECSGGINQVHYQSFIKILFLNH